MTFCKARYAKEFKEEDLVRVDDLIPGKFYRNVQNMGCPVLFKESHGHFKIAFSHIRLNGIFLVISKRHSQAYDLAKEIVLVVYEDQIGYMDLPTLHSWFQEIEDQ